MGIASIEGLKALFSQHAVETLYIKQLAPRQDNEKNQIYLGGGLDGIANLFPGEVNARSASTSERKRASAAGKAKLEVKLRLAWIGKNGILCPAPNARLIDYFQYPEVRLSGFLKGCDHPPDALRRERQSEYGKRILVLGLRPDGLVLGHVLTARNDPLVAAFPALPELPAARTLQVLTVAGSIGSTPRDLLAAELRRIVAGGWHPSVILKTGRSDPLPFRGAQGGGYTLEALLGVCANSSKAPDCHGYEIKAYGNSRISLMTPSPDGGFQGNHTFKDFMGEFATDGTKNDRTKRFTGVFRCGEETRRMRLLLRGYDPVADKFSGRPSDIRVELKHEEKRMVVASWSLEHLASSWNGKHASALYVRYERRDSSNALHGGEYRYASKALVGEGTDVWRLLRAIYTGLVFYDPAHTIYDDGRSKVRPQWRINVSSLKDAMKELYAETSELSL